MSLVLKGVTTTSISPDSTSVLSKITNTSKRKIPTLKSPISGTSHLGVIKQSIRDKIFCKTLQILSQNQEEHLLRFCLKIKKSIYSDFVSKSRRASTQKVYDAKWIVYSNWCHRKKVNPVSAHLTVIADFLTYLFSEKKSQISTIKGYRSIISNTLKFKTGNRIGSNLVLSEFIRSFELQHPVQRSLTPKWDLS